MHARNERLKLCERLVSLCWFVLVESCRGRVIDRIDPTSGTLSYRAFLESADQSLRDSYRDAEPAVLVAVDVEGVRRLHDNSKSALAYELMQEIGAVLADRIRQDDVLGVLDSSRFLLLLRRVDSELGMLIIRQLIGKLTAICENPDRWGSEVSVRCGVAGSGFDQPALSKLITRALGNVQQARQQGISIVSEVLQLAGTQAS